MKTLSGSLCALLLTCMLPTCALAAPPTQAPVTVQPQARPISPKVFSKSPVKPRPADQALGTERFRRSGSEIWSARRADLLVGCGFRDESAPYVASVNVGDGGNVLCGACAEVTGATGTVLVKITSSTPDGPVPSGGLTIDESAFSAVAGRSAGRATLNWRLVPCPETGPLRYGIQLAGSYWYGVTVQNPCRPIQRIEMRTAGGAWTALTRGAFWSPASGGAPVGVIDLRLRDFDGNVTEERALDLRGRGTEISLVGSAAPVGCR